MIGITPKLAGLVSAVAVALAAPAAFAAQTAHTHTSAASVWSFPACDSSAWYEYMYTGNPNCRTADTGTGTGAAATSGAASVTAASVPARFRTVVGGFAICDSAAEYEYYAGTSCTSF